MHLHDRQRHTVGGREVAIRDHRTGIKYQQLRAHAAMLLDWFRMAARHGWLSSLRTKVRQNHIVPKVRSMADRLANVVSARKRRGLQLPCGPQAATLGIGMADPPRITKPRSDKDERTGKKKSKPKRQDNKALKPRA